MSAAVTATTSVQRRRQADSSTYSSVAASAPASHAQPVLALPRRPYTQIIVLFASDLNVLVYAQSVQGAFISAGSDVWLQTEFSPAQPSQQQPATTATTPAGTATALANQHRFGKTQWIRPEHLVEIINSSCADCLIVIGDRNLRNETCQAQKRGKLKEMGVQERIRELVEEWNEKTGLTAFFRDFERSEFAKLALIKSPSEVSRLSEYQLVGWLRERLGLCAHARERADRLKDTCKVLSSWFRNRPKPQNQNSGAKGPSSGIDFSSPSDQEMVTKLTHSQTAAVRLHKELCEAFDLVSSASLLTSDAEINRLKQLNQFQGDISTFFSDKQNDSKAYQHILLLGLFGKGSSGSVVSNDSSTYRPGPLVSVGRENGLFFGTISAAFRDKLIDFLSRFLDEIGKYGQTLAVICGGEGIWSSYRSKKNSGFNGEDSEDSVKNEILTPEEETLFSMGFAISSVREALSFSHGDVELALNELLNGKFPSPESSSSGLEASDGNDQEWIISNGKRTRKPAQTTTSSSSTGAKNTQPNPKRGVVSDPQQPARSTSYASAAAKNAKQPARPVPGSALPPPQSAQASGIFENGAEPESSSSSSATTLQDSSTISPVASSVSHAGGKGDDVSSTSRAPGPSRELSSANAWGVKTTPALPSLSPWGSMASQVSLNSASISNDPVIPNARFPDDIWGARVPKQQLPKVEQFGPSEFEQSNMNRIIGPRGTAPLHDLGLPSIFLPSEPSSSLRIPTTSASLPMLPPPKPLGIGADTSLISPSPLEGLPRRNSATSTSLADDIFLSLSIADSGLQASAPEFVPTTSSMYQKTSSSILQPPHLMMTPQVSMMQGRGNSSGSGLVPNGSSHFYSHVPPPLYTTSSGSGSAVFPPSKMPPPGYVQPLSDSVTNNNNNNSATAGWVHHGSFNGSSSAPPPLTRRMMPPPQQQQQQQPQLYYSMPPASQQQQQQQSRSFVGAQQLQPGAQRGATDAFQPQQVPYMMNGHLL